MIWITACLLSATTLVWLRARRQARAPDALTPEEEARLREILKE